MKKKIAFTLLFALFSGIFAGCVSKDATAKPVDSKGVEKVHILYSDAYAIGNPTGASLPDILAEVKQKIINDVGIELVMTVAPAANYTDKLGIMIAGNEDLDCFMADPSFTKKSVFETASSKLIQPINPYFDKYKDQIKACWPADVVDTVYSAVTDNEGNIWALPQKMPIRGNSVFIRKDWLDKLGLPVPKTIDEYNACLEAVKKADPAGNGNTIPMLTSNLSQFSSALAGAYMDVGYDDYFTDADGKVKHIVFNKGYRDFVAQVQDWYKSGILYKEAFTVDVTKARDLIKQNKVFSFPGWYTFVTGNGFTDPNNNWIVADLSGPLGKSVSVPNPNAGGLAIYSKAKNPEGVLKYYAWQNSDIDHYLTAMYGIEGKQWKYVDKDNWVVGMLPTKTQGAKDYVSELVMSPPYSFSAKVIIENPSASEAQAKFQRDYSRNYWGNLSDAKKPALYNYTSKMNWSTINKDAPELSDIKKMIDEQIIKFMMGTTNMSEYDSFLANVQKINYAKVSDILTAELNRVK